MYIACEKLCWYPEKETQFSFPAGFNWPNGTTWSAGVTWRGHPRTKGTTRQAQTLKDKMKEAFIDPQRRNIIYIIYYKSFISNYSS